jgi:DNA repair protein RecN (Recombination protein N)
MLVGDGDGRVPPILDLMGEVSEALQDLAKMDVSQQEMAGQAEMVLDTLSEIERQLRLYSEAVEYNPRRLDQLEDRLDLLNRLKRKYGGSLETVIAFGNKCRADMESLNSADERIAALEAEELTRLSALGEKALALSAARVMASVALGKGIEAELNDLGMGGARFQVQIAHQPDEHGVELANGQRVAFSDRGIDNVEFLIAPNQGEGFKPLVKTASGGETARLMLALKNVLVEADTVPTLIFDEIDQGIGGRLGLVVGEKLWRLGREHQVLCVTHLPQLAAFGDHHFRVEKHLTHDARTTTRVHRVAGESRTNELAEMMGGVREVNREAAVDLVSLAQRRQAALVVGRGLERA